MSGGSQTSTSATSFSSETGPWSPQVPYILGGFQKAKELYEQGPPDYYPGETLAGFDPAQTFAQEAIIDYARGPRAAGMQAGAEASLMQGLSGRVDSSAYDPMAQAYAQDVIGNLQANILPGIRQQQVMYQPGGSSRAALQQNKAVADAVKSGMTTPLAQMYTNAYNQAQQRAVESGRLYPSIMGAPLSMYGAIADIGAQRRAMTQEAMNRDQARYAYEAGAPMNALQNYMSMITGNYGSTSSGGSSTTSTVPTQSPIAGILGSLGQAAIMAQSDIRIKENIIPEGTTWKGLSIYNYNYVGDATPRRGVMAQQVERMYPDAVVTIDGIKHVNYGAI
jgi:hypothetical protein